MQIKLTFVNIVTIATVTNYLALEYREQSENEKNNKYYQKNFMCTESELNILL